MKVDTVDDVMQRIYAAASLTEAYLLLHRLQQAGIAARVFNEHAHGAMGEIPFTHAYPELWVEHDRDVARARALIDEYERAGNDAAAWICPTCGESNPSAFEICWRCSAASH